MAWVLLRCMLIYVESGRCCSLERPSKTFKRVRKQREFEFIPPHNPNVSHVRHYRKARMSWMLDLIYRGRVDVLMALALLIGLLLVALGFVIYIAVNWLLNWFWSVI